MSQAAIHRVDPRPHLSARARLLRSLERYFPPVADAPAASGEHATWQFGKAAGSYGPFVERLGGLAGKAVLDFGCGWGGETAWLAERATLACGCDINDDALRDAERFRVESGKANLRFAACTATTLPFADAQFDAVFSTNVFEHVMEPVAMLREIRRVLKPGGSFLSRFGPLFHSPLGYHLCWATQVPWAHLVFGLGPVIEVRNTKRSPIHPTSWRDTGLNEMTFAQFRRAVREADLDAEVLRRLPVRGLTPLAHLPLVGNLFTFGIECQLVRPR